MAIFVANPIPVWLDNTGAPLQGGKIYIGVPNTDPTTNPISVFQDEALTVPFPQPIVTTNGAPSLQGSPRQIFLAAGTETFSIAVFDSAGNMVQSIPSCEPAASAPGAANRQHDVFVSGIDFTPGASTLTLSGDPGSGENVSPIYFDAVPQFYPEDFTLSGRTVTFTSPITPGTSKVRAIWGDLTTIGTPANGTVTSGAIAPGAVLAPAIQQPATEQLYADNGAQISRMNDRVFVGDATFNDGNYPNVELDWLNVLQTNSVITTGPVAFAQMAVLQNNLAGAGIVAGARTYNFTSANSAAIGIESYGYANNKAGHAADAWAYYGEAHRLQATDGNIYGIEISVCQRGGASVYQTPYSGPIGLVTGIQIDSGNSLGVAQEPGLTNASSAMTIVQNTSDNSAPFLKGIIFSNNSIQSNSNIAEAISFFEGCSLQWYGSGGNQTSAIYCQGSSGAGGIHQVFQDNGVQFLNSNGAAVFSINSSTGIANSIGIAPNASGSAPIIEAQGTDASIGINLQMKGGALLSVTNTTLANSATAGGAASLPALPAQYWEVSLNGTTLKIPCYNV